MDERVYITVDPDRLRTEPIRVWAFDDAPIELQAYSDNGGDEDWLAFVPVGYAEHDIAFLQCGHFGKHRTRVHTMDGGDRVFIGVHS